MQKRNREEEERKKRRDHTQKGILADAKTFSFISSMTFSLCVSCEGFLFLFPYMIFPGLNVKLRGIMLSFVVDKEYILKIAL